MNLSHLPAGQAATSVIYKSKERKRLEVDRETFCQTTLTALRYSRLSVSIKRAIWLLKDTFWLQQEFKLGCFVHVTLQSLETRLKSDSTLKTTPYCLFLGTKPLGDNSADGFISLHISKCLQFTIWRAIIKSRDTGIMQTVITFSFLSKECVSRSFQVLWTLQARGDTEAEREGTAYKYTLPWHHRWVLSVNTECKVSFPQAFYTV